MSRRSLLLGAGLGMSLSGCAGLIHGQDDPGVAHRSGWGTGLGILIFEHVGQSFAFHTAAVIEASGGRALYDPGGWWSDDHGQRVRDLTHGLTPDREDAYLQRDYFGAEPGEWRLHRFDRPLHPDEADLALHLAQEMPPVVFGMCCWALTTVLSELESFAGLPVTWWPASLLEELHGRAGLRYAARLVPERRA